MSCCREGWRRPRHRRAAAQLLDVDGVMPPAGCRPALRGGRDGNQGEGSRYGLVMVCAGLTA
jgi:hypothetical protein